MQRSSSGSGPPKRERPNLAGSGALENSGNNTIPSNRTVAETQQALDDGAPVAARWLERRHHLRPAIARLVAIELGLRLEARP
jgi:hypothetical protein